ncbi:MAG TPA: hypothetical protein VNF06_00375 [Candidatus Aquilonibacter sp.]|nr:hypothetical protein [Candidatus Aquilonibacter sp.]
MEQNDEWATFIKRKKKINGIKMENNPIDFSVDLIGKSGPGVPAYVPKNLEEASTHQAGAIPKIGTSVEDAVFATISIDNLESQGESSKPTLEFGYVPKIPEIKKEKVTQILDTVLGGATVEPIDYERIALAKGGIEKGLKTGSRVTAIESYRQLRKAIFERATKSEVVQSVQKIIQTPKKVVKELERNLTEVERHLLHSIRKGHIKQYTLPVAIAVANMSDKFAVGLFIDAAHAVKNPDLVEALGPVYRSKVENRPIYRMEKQNSPTTKAKLKLVQV